MTQSDLTVVSGTVVKGNRVASGQTEDSPFPKGTIELQQQQFLERGLDISDYFFGTLNISIKPKKFKLLSAEFNFKNVRWIESFPPEDFSMSFCDIRFQQKQIKGLIYYPHPKTKIGHFKDTSTIEVIAPRIDGITYGSKVELSINQLEFEIYSEV